MTQYDEERRIAMAVPETIVEIALPQEMPIRARMSKMAVQWGAMEMFDMWMGLCARTAAIHQFSVPTCFIVSDLGELIDVSVDSCTWMRLADSCGLCALCFSALAMGGLSQCDLQRHWGRRSRHMFSVFAQKLVWTPLAFTASSCLVRWDTIAAATPVETMLDDGGLYCGAFRKPDGSVEKRKIAHTAPPTGARFDSARARKAKESSREVAGHCTEVNERGRDRNGAGGLASDITMLVELVKPHKGGFSGNARGVVAGTKDIEPRGLQKDFPTTIRQELGSPARKARCCQRTW